MYKCDAAQCYRRQEIHLGSSRGSPADYNHLRLHVLACKQGRKISQPPQREPKASRTNDNSVQDEWERRSAHVIHRSPRPRKRLTSGPPAFPGSEYSQTRYLVLEYLGSKMEPLGHETKAHPSFVVDFQTICARETGESADGAATGLAWLTWVKWL